MARTVTCKITKEKGNSDIFYKAPDGKWYKSESIYLQSIKDKQTHDEIVHCLLNYLGYEKGEPFPALLNKKLKEYDYYPLETILETLHQCEESIRWAMQTKDFSSTTNKIFYIFAIISNRISDVDREIKRKAVKKREVIPPIIEDFNITQIGTSVKGKDISSFLED